jgi:hypothetical protein
MKKIIGIFLVGLMLLSFLSLFCSSYFLANKALILSEENVYEINVVLDSSMVLQKDLKSTVSFLLLYLAFSNPEHKDNFYIFLDKSKEDSMVLDSFVRSEDQKKEVQNLKDSLESLEIAGDNLLRIHEKNPGGFILGEYDELSNIVINSASNIMDSSFQISKVNIIDYGLGINLISNKIELTLASYYWGTIDNKNVYLMELDMLNKSILKYYDLPLKDRKQIRDIFEKMQETFENLDYNGNEILKLVERGVKRSPEDLKIILPYVASTNELMNYSNQLTTRSYPSKLDVKEKIDSLIKIFNLINLISLIVFLISFFIFFIFHFWKKK